MLFGVGVVFSLAWLGAWTWWKAQTELSGWEAARRSNYAECANGYFPEIYGGRSCLELLKPIGTFDDPKIIWIESFGSALAWLAAGWGAAAIIYLVGKRVVAGRAADADRALD